MEFLDYIHPFITLAFIASFFFVIETKLVWASLVATCKESADDVFVVGLAGYMVISCINL